MNVIHAIASKHPPGENATPANEQPYTENTLHTSCRSGWTDTITGAASRYRRAGFENAYLLVSHMALPDLRGPCNILSTNDLRTA